MRRLWTLLSMILLTLIMAVGLCLQTFPQAAQANQPTTTGTVVATPQSSLPATLLLQVGSQTIAVTITSSTQLTRQFGGTSNLAEFADGDVVSIVGTPNQSGGITASLIQNTSVQSVNTELQGIISSIAPAGVVPATVLVTNLTALGGAQAPFPSPLPSPMSLPVGAATVMTINGTSGPASTLIGQLQVNNLILASGVYDRAVNRFDSVTSLQVLTPPPTPLEVKGSLAAAPSQLTAPTVLCVQNAQVQSNTAVPNASVVSACPAGQLPVYVTGRTSLLRLYDGQSALFELSAGDNLDVKGSLSNGQFTASQVQDLSIQSAHASLQGTVQSVTANGNVTNVGVMVTQNDGSLAPFAMGASLTLPLANSNSPNCTAPSQTQYPCTRVSANGSTSNGYNAGQIAVLQTVHADGVYNKQRGGFLYISDIVVSSSTPPTATAVPPTATAVPSTPTAVPPTATVVPPSTRLTIKGTLAANPSGLTAPVTLCVTRAAVVGKSAAPNITISACPSGELPVYITGSTRIVRFYLGTSSLDELSVGDTLIVTGRLVNTQFMATLVRDLSIQAAYTRVVGRVGFVSPSSTPPYFTVRTMRDAGRKAPFSIGQVLTVLVGPTSQIITRGGTTTTVTVLNPGQMVTIVGVYNRHRHGFVSTFRVRVW